MKEITKQIQHLMESHADICLELAKEGKLTKERLQGEFMMFMNLIATIYAVAKMEEDFGPRQLPNVDLEKKPKTIKEEPPADGKFHLP